MDISDAFAAWMAADDYREEYFASPEDLQLKLQAEFPEYVAERLRAMLTGGRSHRKLRRRAVRGRCAVRLRAPVPHLENG